MSGDRPKIRKNKKTGISRKSSNVRVRKETPRPKSVREKLAGPVAPKKKEPSIPKKSIEKKRKRKPGTGKILGSDHLKARKTKKNAPSKSRTTEPKSASKHKVKANPASVTRKPRPKRTDKDGWKGLENQTVRRPRAVPRSLQDPLLQRIATIKLAFFTILALVICTIYIDHVLDTKELFADVQEVREENRGLHLKMNRLTSELESRRNPALVLKRAEELELKPSRHFGAPIDLSQSDIK